MNNQLKLVIKNQTLSNWEDKITTAKDNETIVTPYSYIWATPSEYEIVVKHNSQLSDKSIHECIAEKGFNVVKLSYS